MSTAATMELNAAETGSVAPTRLHHFNYVCRDHEETRTFYEDVLGIPLVSFFCEVEQVPGLGEVVLGHAFYGLADGSQIAIMNFPNHPDMREPALEAARTLPNTIHLAVNVTAKVQERAREKLTDAGVEFMEVDHGVVRSIYFRDPNGITIEYTVDPTNVAELSEYALRTAHENMRAYLAGDHSEQKHKMAKTVTARFDS
ncbi:VOC family protein [Sphingomonas bisphenolicum]